MSHRRPIPRLLSAGDAKRVCDAALTGGRCFVAGMVAILLILVSVAPDPSPDLPARPDKSVATMKASMPGKAPASVSVSSTDADLPPGDARPLGPALPSIERLPASARFVRTALGPPFTMGLGFPERPPKTA